MEVYLIESKDFSVWARYGEKVIAVLIFFWRVLIGNM